jgi:hypothetical protein
LRLQNALPHARVLYVSATGATTVSNLAYAVRLGLWGSTDMSFATRQDFVAAMEAGGIAAMEVLARDLKALGLYASRALSYAAPTAAHQTLYARVPPKDRAGDTATLSMVRRVVSVAVMAHESHR